MPETRNGLQLGDGRTASLLFYTPGDSILGASLRGAFSFIRANGDRHYSANVLMTLMDIADRLDNNPEAESAIVLQMQVPYSYDEDTETKSGGILGVLVGLPDGRMILASHRNARRIGVGRHLVQFMQRYTVWDGGPNFWIHQGNADGQMFALAAGMQPYEINRNGAVLYRFSPPSVADDAVADMDDREIENRLRRGRRPSRPLTSSFTAFSAGVPVSPPRAPRRIITADPPTIEEDDLLAVINDEMTDDASYVRYWREPGTAAGAPWTRADETRTPYQRGETNPGNYIMPVGRYMGCAMGVIRRDYRAYFDLLVGQRILPYSPRWVFAASDLHTMMSLPTNDGTECDDPFCGCRMEQFREYLSQCDLQYVASSVAFQGT